MDSLVSDALEDAEEDMGEGTDAADDAGATTDAPSQQQQTRQQTDDQPHQQQSQARQQAPAQSQSQAQSQPRTQTGAQTDTSPGGDFTDTTAMDTSGNMSDAELREVLDDLQTTVTVVGCGGGGSNTVNRMKAEGIEGANLYALNTDVQHLLEVNSDDKLLIGEQKTRGRGAGAVPAVGEEAALESQQDIDDAVEGSDMVFVTAGMGGGTGTGAAPVVAEAAKDAGALTIAVVTLPFESEGERRRANAKEGLKRLQKAADTVIVIENDRLLESVGQLPLQQAFKVCDEVLMRSVKGITELITTSGLVNLDFADVHTTLENGGMAMIGLGESDNGDKATNAVKDALRSPLLDVDISDADSALVNVTGGPDMDVNEAEGVVDYVHDRISDDARIIWGTSIDEELQGEMRTMIVVTGVDSPQIYSRHTSDPTTDRSADAEQLGGQQQAEPDPVDDIDYVE